MVRMIKQKNILHSLHMGCGEGLGISEWMRELLRVSGQGVDKQAPGKMKNTLERRHGRRR